MKVLVFCQYYFPEPFRINDICEELVKRGHEVKVVTGEPNYPEGYIYSGYENHAKVDEVLNGVSIHRCPIIPRKKGTFYRMLNYFSYPMCAKRYAKNLMASDGTPYDVIFVNQLSPVMMGEPAIKYKKKRGTPIVMYCLDLWPESLVAGGIKRGSLVYRVFHLISGRIYNSMDRVLITSRLFRNYLVEEFNMDSTKIDYLPQYAEGIFETIPFRKHEGQVNLVFAGNIGSAQSVDTIISAAKRLQNKDIHFHIVGGGVELERLKSISQNLKNVTFYGRRPLEDMPEFYKNADAMLITLQSDPILSLTLPGKVQSYMAVGKPIIGAVDGETAYIISDAECGYCGRAENVDDLVDNICRFIDEGNGEVLGRNARDYYEQHFERSIFMDRIEMELQLQLSN